MKIMRYALFLGFAMFLTAAAVAMLSIFIQHTLIEKVGIAVLYFFYSIIFYIAFKIEKDFNPEA